MRIVATQNPDAVEIVNGAGLVRGVIRRDWPGEGGWCLVVPSGDGATSVSYEMMKEAVSFIEHRKRQQNLNSERISWDPHVSPVSPVIRGTWVTTAQVASMVVDGYTWEEILRRLPEIDEDDIRAALAYEITE